MMAKTNGKNNKITQEEVWESQKRFYDTITGLIYGFIIAFLILGSFVVVGYFLYGKQEYVPAKPAEPPYNKMLRVLVESNLLNAGYIDFNYFTIKALKDLNFDEEKVRNLQLPELVNLSKCVLVDYDYGLVMSLYALYFEIYKNKWNTTVADYFEGKLNGVIYCKKDAYIFDKGGSK
ncbi:MAG: hypothetical protein J7L39_03830 [Candidatus Aenigmarchaeota archaeon]|nr:hypothetical protein [Candidatus Aenigmarchaeota archaeon]